MQQPLTVLLTGFTSRQANTVSEKTDIYITFAPILKKMLEKLGHVVDWRPVTFGEQDIEKYDLVLCGCSDPNSMTGQTHRYGAIWSMLNARRLILWFDDWRIKGQLHTFLQKPEVFWNTRMLHEKQMPTHEQALMFKDPIDAMLKGLATDHRPPVVAQLFNWGDEAKFLKEVPEAKWLMRFDVGSFVPNFVEQPIPMEQRTRQWVAASLTQMNDYIDKLKPTIPVFIQAKPRGRSFGGWKKMHEREVVTELYAKSLGVISKPYPHAGSGWWRVRFNYAVHARSIMIADPKEAGAAGQSFRLYLPFVEKLSPAEMQDLANKQAEEFLSWQDSQDQACEKMSNGLIRLLDEPVRPEYL